MLRSAKARAMNAMDDEYEVRSKLEAGVGKAERKSFGIDDRYAFKSVKKAKYKNDPSAGDISAYNKRLVDPNYSESAVDIFGSSTKKRKSKNSSKYVQKVTTGSKLNFPSMVSTELRGRSHNKDFDDNYFHAQSKPTLTPIMINHLPDLTLYKIGTPMLKTNLRTRHADNDEFHYKTFTPSHPSEDVTTYDIEEKLNDLSSQNMTSMSNKNVHKSPLLSNHRLQRDKVSSQIHPNLTVIYLDIRRL
jgi:hypothetical protein